MALSDSEIIAAHIWRLRSIELYQAANVVWAAEANTTSITPAVYIPPQPAISPTLYRPATLLIGMAIETALKGLLVAQGTTAPPTHNLVKLAQLAGLSLSTNETELLTRLHQDIEWTSKYPEPKPKNAARQPPRQLIRRIYLLNEIRPLYERAMQQQAQLLGI